MGKYKNLEKDIFDICDGLSEEGVKVFPDNFSGSTDGEFLRLSIIASGTGINLKSTSGLIKIDIFTKAGRGPARASELADKLDTYLVGKSFNTTTGCITQFKNSSFTPYGVDQGDSSLYRSIYSIPFNYFGV